jgi:hypothetical protein
MKTNDKLEKHNMNENKINEQESNPTNVPANPPTSEPVNPPKDKQSAQSQLEKEMAKWRTKMDEAKVQLHLGAKEAQDKIQPYVDQLEQELAEADKKWKEFETATESAWQDIRNGLKLSFKAMQQSFEKAEQQFKKGDEKKS